jgi:ligand-binding sensor domain-containing protein
MRRLILSMLVFPALSGLQATQWHTYTNTNSITDVVFNVDKIYASTWGGVAVYDLPQNSVNLNDAALSRVITSVDGLTSNDIRTLAYETSTGDLWAGSYNRGITIIKQTGIQVLDANSGLPTDKVRRIIVDQSYIYVATDFGISQFYYLPGVSFPLLLNQFTVLETQGGLVSDDVRDIAISPAGYLYCATSAGVSFVHKDSLNTDSAWHQWIPSNSPIANYPVLSLSVNDNYIALNTKMSVHRRSLDPSVSDWMTWTRASAGLLDSVFTVAINSSDGINVAYGLWDEETMTILHKTAAIYDYINFDGSLMSQSPELNEMELPTQPIFRFIIKPDGVVFATWGQGILSYENFINSHLENNCIGFQTISEIATDQNYNLWLTSGWIGAGMTRKGTRGVSKLDNGFWQNYNTGNSPLTNDNTMSVAIDQNNRKWFGSWDADSLDYGWHPGVNVYDDSNNAWLWYTRDGICTWSENNGWSNPETGSPEIFNNTIVEIYVDRAGNILIVSSGAGITVFDKDYNLVGTFQLPESLSLYQQAISIYHSGSRYFFGSNNDGGLIIWDSNTLPTAGGSHWLTPPVSDLSDCYIYGIVTITNTFGEEENWIASSTGLFMWDGTDWFRYDADIKRRKFVNGIPVDETLYYVDEERLFGSIREAQPTTIFLDPFNRIWIGSLENGITMYDPDSERFTNYYQGKSPLLSNYITCFGYDPIAGNLLIGTPDGLNTLAIGIEIKTEEQLNTVKAFPNPFFPTKDGAVRIVNLPSESMPKGTNICKIYDSSGAQVIELKENHFARFDWNGRNNKNKPCSSGIYFFVVTDANGETKRGKIALIREN